ncbi:hypothetical protein KKA09_04170 [Patescibacteria group bacterium]|nr:hypothetical protein [Patescibacteria group bacterium]
MECKFCLKDKKLIDAHIIPRCFFEAMRDKKDNRPFQLLSNTKNEYSQKLWIGLYDKNILCEDCEKVFQKYDDYACKALLSNIDESDYILDPNGNKIGYKLENVDYKKLKLFFLSVLWRASVSKRKEFKKVDIGRSFEDRLKAMVKNFDPGSTNDFLLVLRRFIDDLGKNFLMDPYKLRIDEINFYRFYLGAGYEFHIKVDKRNLKKSDVLYLLALRSESLLYVPFRENLLSSKEFPILKDILNKSKKR